MSQYPPQMSRSYSVRDNLRAPSSGHMNQCDTPHSRLPTPLSDSGENKYYAKATKNPYLQAQLAAGTSTERIHHPQPRAWQPSGKEDTNANLVKTTASPSRATQSSRDVHYQSASARPGDAPYRAPSHYRGPPMMMRTTSAGNDPQYHHYNPSPLSRGDTYRKDMYRAEQMSRPPVQQAHSLHRLAMDRSGSYTPPSRAGSAPAAPIPPALEAARRQVIEEEARRSAARAKRQREEIENAQARIKREVEKQNRDIEARQARRLEEEANAKRRVEMEEREEAERALALLDAKSVACWAETVRKEREDADRWYEVYVQTFIIAGISPCSECGEADGGCFLSCCRTGGDNLNSKYPIEIEDPQYI